MIGDQYQAEDITQETFIKLYHSLGKNETIINHKAWLYKVASNLCKNKIRRKSVFRRMISKNPNPIENMENNGEENILQSEKIEIFRKVLSKLSPREQILLQLYKDGFSYHEISEVTNIKKDHVGTVLSRAIIKCSKLIDKEKS